MLKRKVLPSTIRNKIKRGEVYHKQQVEKKKEKKKRIKKRKREEEVLGEEAPPKAIPKTIDNTREFDETIVQPDDEEVFQDEAQDEFAEYLKGDKPAKMLFTTSIHYSTQGISFVKELVERVFPNSEYHKRGTFDIKSIVQFAINREFTDLIIINENRLKPNALLLIHLPSGPTAHFKLNSIVLSKDILEHGKVSSSTHKPELILNNFNTRLGHTIGRMFGCLLPRDPNFKAREVITFHNQRDFIFFRQHRYIFENNKKARLQELGPRFCLKLKSLQHGTFDSIHGEYEWVHKTEMDTSRRRFFL